MPRLTPALGAPALALAVALIGGALPAAADLTADLAPAVTVIESRTDMVTGDLGAATTPGAALAAQADRLGIDAAAFAFSHHRTSLAGTHHRAVQMRDGVAIDGTAALVSVIDGRVTKVQAVGSDAIGGPVAAPVSQDVAESAGLGALGAREAIALSTDRLLVPTAGVLVDTYRVSIVAPGVAGDVDVSAATGAVIGVNDDRRFAGEAAERSFVDAVATLFDPNPIATSGLIDMRQDVDIAGVDVDFSSDSRIDDEYVDLPLVGFDQALAAGGLISGDYANVVTAGPVVPVLGRLDVVKSDPRFEGLMAYHHVTAIQEYFQDVLGLDNINNEQQEIITLPTYGYDNSFYQPANDLMLLGNGGVDDGEDAEVIIHELGHAIHYDQVPNWGRKPEGGAMGEGFGDFLAATYYATFEGTVRSQDTCLMEWDSTSYASGPQTCIRRMDTNKTYASKVGQVHADGEIWSKFMWNVREHLGETEAERSENVLRLLLTAHFDMSTQADFREAIASLQSVVGAVAPDADTATAWDDVIYDEAVAMGMPIALRPVVPTGQ